MFNKIVMNKKLCIALALVAVAAAGLAVYYFTASRADSTSGTVVEVSALNTTGHGVKIDTGFLLTCSEHMNEQAVRNSIAVTPLANYALKHQSGNEYVLNFDEELEPDSIISFTQTDTVKSYSWAFQTENIFRITQTLPADKSKRVPVNTGIEISLSYLDVADFQNSFRIEPSTAGKYEKHGKTWVFIPDGLQPNTLYKVTIDKGLKSSGGELLGEDYTFSFRTNETTPNSDYLYINGEAAETFAPNVTPVIEVRASEHYNGTDLRVRVFKFSDSGSYLKALKARHDYINEQLGYENDYFASSDSLEQIWDFTTEIKRENPQQTWSPAYIVLPEKLPEGHYLIDAAEDNTAGDKTGHIQKFLQIHPYAVYVMSVNGAELVWVNDTGSSSPVEGVRAEINGISSKTAADGTARIDTPELDADSFNSLTIKGAGLPFAAELSLTEPDDSRKVDEQYYTYIYTDREKYQPTDTVSIWGIVLPKDGKSNSPGEAELQLDIGAYDQTPQKIKVSLDDSGAFSGKIAISGLASGYYSLKLISDNTVYCNTNIIVGEYVKPSYLIEASTDKPAYFAWEPINLTGMASFFDGTPAGNMPFDVYNGGGIDENLRINSDENGMFQSRLEFKDTRSSWHPESLYYSINTAGAEDAQSSTAGSVIVFPRDTMIQSTLKENPDGFSINVNTNRIDISSLKNGNDIYTDNYERIKGASVDIPVTVKIFEVTWNRIQEGTYYDYINKVTIPKYRYVKSEKQVETRTGITENGSLLFDKLGYSNTSEHYYYALIECADTRGSAISDQVDFYGNMYPNQSDIKYYTFSHQDSEGFSVGDTVNIKLLENSHPALNKGRLLYAVVQNSLGDYKTTEGTSFNYTFDQADIPNVSICGAYFDGKNIFPVSKDFFAYDPEEMQLTVTTVPDGDSFPPGSEVHLDINVTDKNQNPVKGAAVCVSVVDEAAFAVADQNADPLGEIYSRYFYPQVTTYSSYVQHDFSGSSIAEGGGEGGSDYIRKNFLDTAAFLTATTDKQGHASLTFSLPDNLTAWRVTALAVSNGVYAGNSRMDIKTTQPFFADLLINKVFIKEDNLAAAVRGFGTALKSSSEIEFNAVLRYPDGTKKDFAGIGKAQEYVNLNLGTGPEGDYTLTVTAKSAAGTDSIEKSFRVVGSALEIPVIKTFSLADGIDIDALRSPVTLVFFDQSRSLYNECLQSLASGYGVRADIRASRAAAQKLLKELYGKDLSYYFYGVQTQELEPGSLQDYTGGVKLLDYGEPQAELTARLCAAAPEYLNTTAAAAYLNSVINNKKSQPTDIAAAYMGLAALREPVLIDVRYLLENEKSFSLQEKLYLTAGLAFIGDRDNAGKYYDQIAAPLITKNDPWVYLNSGESRDTDIECTAIAALTAMKTDRDDLDGMLRYIIANSSDEVTTCLERLAYVREKPESDGVEAAFSYMENGSLKTVIIEKNQACILDMTAEELKAAKFNPVSGDAGVCATFTGSAADVVDEDSNFVSLQKIIEPVDGTSITQSSLVKITLIPTFSEDAPKGWYELSEYIPSGMRYVSSKGSWDYNWWTEEIEGQKISFSVINIDKDSRYYNSKKQAPVVYYARAVLTGTFIADSAYIKHTETAAWGMSVRKDVTIGE
jgi:hypothetical protein